MAQNPVMDGNGGAGARGLSPAGDLVRRQDRDRFVLTLLAPAARREALFGLFAHAVEAARVPALVSEPVFGVMRLQYWRDLIEAADPPAAARGNPVADGLARETLPLLGAGGRALLIEALDAQADDLSADPPPDGAAARRLAWRTAGATVEAAALLLGASDDNDRRAARHVGTAWGLLGLARGVPAALRQGRVRLPVDAVAAAGVDVRAISEGRDRERAGIRAGVAALVTLAETELAAGEAVRVSASRRARPVLRHAVLARYLARALRRAGYDPFAGRVAALPPPTARLIVAHLSGR
jgi:phytoene synthase